MKFHWGPAFLLIGTTFLLTPIILNMTFYTIMCTLVISLGLVLTSIQIRSTLQTHLVALQQTLDRQANNIVLDDVCQTIVNFFNDIILCGGIGSLFGTWCLYSFPFSDDQRLKLIHSFAFAEQEEESIRKMMFSPGGAFHFFWDTPKENTNDSSIQMRCGLESDMEWQDEDALEDEVMDVMKKKQGGKISSLKIYPNSEDSDANSIENSIDDELSTTQNNSSDDTTYVPTEPSTNSSIQSVEEANGETDLQTSSVHGKLVNQPKKDCCIDQSLKEESNKFSFAPSPEQTIYHIVSQIIQEYSHYLSSHLNNPDRSSSHYPPKLIQQLSIVSTVLLCTHLYSSRTARKALGIIIHSIGLMTCLSISTSSSLLYFTLSTDMKENWDSRKMILVLLQSLLRTNNPSKTSIQENNSLNTYEQKYTKFSTLFTSNILSKQMAQILQSIQGELSSGSIQDEEQQIKKRKKWNRLMGIVGFVIMMKFGTRIRRKRK